MARLRRSDCAGPGIARRRRGRGFEYRHAADRRVEDPSVIERAAALAIPPAWRDVWICEDPLGHLQATGIDAAGRKQYLYHERWRARRDQQKFDSMLDFARALPRLRRRVRRDLRGEDAAITRTRALACATRLLDLGFFRIGSEGYAERNQSYGLATIRRAHVTLEGEEVVFDYPAKSGQHRIQAIVDEDVRTIVKQLLRRRGGGPELLAFRDGRRWRDVRSDDINAYVKDVGGDDFTAKDFRTWNATVLAAVAVAQHEQRPASPTAHKRAVSTAVKQVAGYLGNTPAVARASYIDPRALSLGLDDRRRPGGGRRRRRGRCPPAYAHRGGGARPARGPPQRGA